MSASIYRQSYAVRIKLTSSVNAPRFSFEDEIGKDNHVAAFVLSLQKVGSLLLRLCSSRGLVAFLVPWEELAISSGFSLTVSEW